MTPNTFHENEFVLFVFVLVQFIPWPTSPSYSGQRPRSARGSQCPITGDKGIDSSIFKVLKLSMLKTQFVEDFWLHN